MAFPFPIIPWLRRLPIHSPTTANATLTYQFSANEMVGAAGTFTICTTRTQSQVPGLYDSSSRGGSAFYNSPAVENALHRGYISIPDVPGLIRPLGQSETQTHSIFLFYTVYLKPTFSISLFGGPQYSNTVQFGLRRRRRGLRRAERASAGRESSPALPPATRSDQWRRWFGGSGPLEQRQRLVAAASHAKPECSRWERATRATSSGRVAGRSATMGIQSQEMPQCSARSASISTCSCNTRDCIRATTTSRRYRAFPTEMCGQFASRISFQDRWDASLKRYLW